MTRDPQTLAAEFIGLDPCIVMGNDTHAAFKLLEGGCPIDVLDGFEMPADFYWLGVVTHGTAVRIDTGEDHGRVTIATVVTRDGSVGSMMLMPDGVSTDAPEGGYLYDRMRAIVAA